MTFSLVSPFSSNSPAQECLKKPRAIVLVNDANIEWKDITITTTTYYLADTFNIEIPLYGQAKGIDLNYWMSGANYAVQIYIGFPENQFAYTKNDLDLFMIGDADEVQIDLLTGTISLSGRDLTSRFIDTKTTQKFSNNTGSQIATIFAKQQGLTTNRIKTTTTTVGTFYQTQQTLLTNEATQWDLLTFLAQQEDFVVFVEKNDLVFEPRPTTSENPYILSFTPPTVDANGISSGVKFNGVQLVVMRSMTLANDADVTIKVPYGTKTGQAFSETARSSRRVRTYLKNVPKPTRKKQKYSYVAAGLTREQALKKAQQILKDITIQEVRLTASVKGENTLKKDGIIKLIGSNSAADQYYYADQVTRHITKEGYDMDISAKNHSVDSQPII